MGNTCYIVAIELSSSKITGVVGVETTEGMRILATASIRVDGFISKGIVRNVDKASEAINDIINRLETDLNNATGESITIKKAYISFAGLSMHSIKSNVSRDFGKYSKITQDIIDGMECDNLETFQTPEGYKRLQVDPQEYKLDGNIDHNPAGAYTQTIECNYLNIVMKEQFYTQLCDSFAQAEIEIEDSFCAAHLDADIMLSKDLRRNGCALVNIGAETTTISIYNNDKPKMLTVLPLGSNNITRDLTAELISFAQAEELKIIRGYKSTVNDGDGIDNETMNKVIYARLAEILGNVRYQIEESGERVHHIVFTGGGSKLKNLKELLDEFLPNFSTEIKPEPQFNLISESGVNVYEVITTALYGLLKQGKANCCEETLTAAQKAAQQNGVLFFPEETETETETGKTEKPDETKKPEKVETKATEENKKPEQQKPVNTKTADKPKPPRKPFFGPLFDFAKTFVTNATSEDENENNDTTTNQ
ncbi:MAG: hypothetical protein J6Q73_08835 [Bacteroidaceae bacterium]|nr:hypothetical protein [Bacteroidaceae bacterium]